MPPRVRTWLAAEVGSPRKAAIIGLLFLAGAVISVAAGTFLPAAFFAAGVAFIVIAYLVTYGARRPSRDDEDRSA